VVDTVKPAYYEIPRGFPCLWCRSQLRSSHYVCTCISLLQSSTFLSSCLSVFLYIFFLSLFFQ